MNLYLLRNRLPVWDEAAAMLVAATSTPEARRIASEAALAEGSTFWQDCAEATYIGLAAEETPPGLILRQAFTDVEFEEMTCA